MTYAIPIIQGEQNWRKSVSAYLGRLPDLTGGAAGQVPVSNGDGTSSWAYQNLIQMVSFETGAYATGTTQIPIDNTIPQNTEGDQYMSLSITPKSATSKLEITVTAFLGVSNADWVVTALFRDSGANAIAAGVAFNDATGSVRDTTFTHIMNSPGTSSTVFKVRAGHGNAAANTISFNGNVTAPFMGGVMASSIVIREYA